MGAAIAVFLTVSPSAAETLRIMALGDSLTQGYGLLDQDGFVPTLQAWLNERGADVIIGNAGVSGDTTAGGLSRIDWTLDPSVKGLIVALGGNDVLRGIDPTTVRANLSGILDRARGDGVEVLLIGIGAPNNYGPDYKRDFEAIYPDLAAEYDTLLHPNFIGAITALDRSEAMSKYMQADGIHPNEAGVDLVVDDIGPKMLDLIARIRN